MLVRDDPFALGVALVGGTSVGGVGFLFDLPTHARILIRIHSFQVIDEAADQKETTPDDREYGCGVSDIGGRSRRIFVRQK